MNADIHWIAGRGPGRIGIVARPRGGDWLHDEVDAWNRAGVQVVVCLLEPAEVAEFGLQAEESECRAQGLRFLSFPIPDRGLPPSRDAALSLADDLARAVARGRYVVVHCRQGVGRSAMMAALVLVRSGLRPDPAFRLVQEARGCPVPDTEEQRAWVTLASQDYAAAVTGLREPSDRIKP